MRVHLLLKAVDFGMVFAIFAVPMAFGGRQSIGQFLLISSAIWTALCWALYQLTRPEPDWVRSRIEPILLAIMTVGVLQVVPLPVSLLNSISPKAAEILPVWFSGDGAGVVEGPWPFLSLSVGESRAGLAIGISYLLLFIVTVQRIRSKEDAFRILRWIATAGAVMAVFGLVQYALSNGKFFWVFEHPQGTTADRPLGGFLNKNHFSHYLALCACPLIWWCFTRLEHHRSETSFSEGMRTGTSGRTKLVAGVLILGLVAVGAAVLLARSRGGILALSAATTVTMLTVYLKGQISGRQMAAMSGIGVVALFVVALFGEQDLARVVQRLDYLSDNGRSEIWDANLKIASDFPLTGTGVGSHRYIYPRYLDQPFSAGEYSHAESSYLQILSETGIVGFGVMIVVLLTCLYWCCRGVRLSQDRETTIALCTLTGALVGACLHAAADFVWYIPGCLMTLVLLMACACRLYQFQRDLLIAPVRPTVRVMPRPVFASGLILLGCSGLWSLEIWLPRLQAEPYWVEYRRLVLADELGKVDPAEDASDKPQDDRGRKKFRQELLAMRNAVRRNPDDARFHIRLATHYETLFNLLQANSDNAMALSQIRDAARDAEFESHEEMLAWLDTAFGGNIQYAQAAARHAQRAIQLNPLEAYGYLYLTELSFLLDAPHTAPRDLLAQSLELRPFNGQVLFVAGRDAILNNDAKNGIKYWSMAFHRNEYIQRQIIHHLAQLTPAVTDVLTTQGFEPDVDALERLIEITESLQQPVEREKALRLLAVKLVDRATAEINRERASDWLRAGWAYGELDEVAEVSKCLDRALESAPSNFVVRLEIAAWKLKQNRSSDALEHLQWCQRISPDHPKVRQLMDRAMNRFAGAPSLRPAGADFQNRRF